MPLVDLKTNLKSLKYGHDTPGGGSSKQPYIKADINTVDSGFNQIRLTSFDDGLIRGGAIGAANASVVDTLRIGKFFVDFPRGPLFIAKQVGLQLSNPRVESITQPTNAPTSGQGFLTNALNFVSNTANKIENALGPTRIYNLGINTLAQVPVNALGGHIVRHGLLPNNDSSKYYENVVTEKNFKNKTNRLLDLTKNFNLGPSGDNKKDVTKGDIVNTAFQAALNPIMGSILLGATSALFASQNTIDYYFGGPNSTYGIGYTLIQRKINTENKEKIDFSIEQSKIKTSNSYSSQVLYSSQSQSSSYFNISQKSFLEQKLSQFSIFAASATGSVDYLNSYSNSLRNFNSAIYKQIKNKILKPTDNKPSSTPPSSSLPNNIPAPTEDNEVKTRSKSNYTLKSNNDIKGDLTTRTWKTKGNLEDILRKSHERTTDLNIKLTENDNTPLLPTRFLGASMQDTDIRSVAATNVNIYDNTVIPYTSIQPSLRKYSELTKVINDTTIPKYINNINKGNIDGGIAVTAPSQSISYKNTYGQEVKLRFGDWSSIAREQRVGDFGEGTVVYAKGKVLRQATVKRADNINLTPLFLKDKYYSDDSVNIEGINYNIRDLAKFRIQAVDTDNPNNGQWMVFRALLSGISDSVDAKWNDINYIGRGTPFYIYGGTTRKIDLKFKVAALSYEEMAPMYRKLNYLMAGLMPDYYNYTAGVMRGVLHRLTIGNYLDAQLGIINSLSYTIPDDSPWEIALDEPEGGRQVLILPHIIEVSMNFTPIGAETQGTNKIEDKNRATTYIAQNNTGIDKDEIQYYSAFTEGKVGSAVAPPQKQTRQQVVSSNAVSNVSSNNPKPAETLNLTSPTSTAQINPSTLTSNTSNYAWSTPPTI
jgi:hypothetical protein